MSRVSKVLHTGKTRTSGGRENGASRSCDGRLDIRFSTPGSARIGTNPEQLFAAAWSACFESAIALAARKRKTALPAGIAVDAEVDLNVADGDHFLSARLNISLPGIDRTTAQALIDEAHKTCPYSKATRGNVDVAINLVREGAMAFAIKVNGNIHSVDVDGDTPLLWVLRDVLGMTGTKFGCGMALCGACTVHIDGVATRSCITPIDGVGNSNVTTIEAIGTTAAGAKIQKAWLDREVVQCGYCQSGQIMSASALLASNPHPSDADIDAAMSGNICRCGTYVRIREAIKQAAQTGQGG